MTTLNKNETYGLTIFFLTLIFLIRGPILDSLVHLSDPTRALFFIAGVYLRAWQVPVILLAGTGLTDAYSISVQNGVGASCITPTYPLLIPSYLALWFGGRFFQHMQIDSGKYAVKLAVILSVSTLLAVIISSGGYYWFSGKYEDPTMAGLGMRMVQYFPGYLGTTFMYVTIAAVFIQIKSFLQDRTSFKGQEVA